MDRRVDIDLVRDMIVKTKSYGIQTGTFIMVGYPKETEDDIQQTVKYLKQANPDQFTITIAYPIKGTGLYHQVQDRITSNLAWESSTDRDIDFERTYSRKYYDYAVRYIVNEVSSHKAQLKEKRGWSRWKFKLKSTAASTLMKWSK